MKKGIKLLLLLLVVTSSLFAVPATPYPVKVKQSDGSTLTIQLYGDEWFSFATTSDGYLLTPNKNGDYEYAKFKNNKILSTGVVARDNRQSEEIKLLKTLVRNPISKTKMKAMIESQRAKKLGAPNHAPNPLYGTAKGIVILVNFTDKYFESNTAQQDYTNLLNEIGYSVNGATGCAKEYFIASTNGQFSPEFDVVGPYTLSHDMAYYGGHSGSSHDTRPDAMVREACQLADEDGLDFTQYDTDNNGKVDMVFVYYAGMNEAEGGGANTIWPHKWQLPSPISIDGKQISVYACTSEKNGHGQMCGIGTFSHEFGHVLGLPDTYNTAQSGMNTVGEWDIMCSGPYNNGGNTPPSWLAFHKFYLGYTEPVVLSEPGEKILEPIITSNQAFILSPPNDTHNLSGSNPNPNYFYIMENRQYIGWDTVATTRFGQLGHGLLITKINYSMSAWETNTPNNDPNNLRFDIIEADGTYGTFSGDTYPGIRNVKQFNPKQLDGSEYDGILNNIEESDDGNITFCYRDCANSPFIKLETNKVELNTIVGDTPDETTIWVTGGKLKENVIIRLMGNNASSFKIRKEGETNWANYISLIPSPEDSTVNQNIIVKYDPSTPSYEQEHTAKFVAKCTSGVPYKTINLTGKSNKKVTVVPPVLKDFTDITSNSAVANWEDVEDASGYYISIYQKNSSTTETENFETFDGEFTDGWSKTMNTTGSGLSGKGVLFEDNKDMISSPFYAGAISNLKFWLKNGNTRQEGFLIIKALGGNNEWEEIARIQMTVSLNTKTYSFDLDVNKQFKKISFSCTDLLERGITIDNYEVTYAANMAVTREYSKGGSNLTATINGLAGGTSYFGKIQASDKDPNGKYNNITDFSNEVAFQTTGSKSDDPRILSVSVNADGTGIVVSWGEITQEEREAGIFLYDIRGALIEKYSIAADQNSIEINNLSKNVKYVISLGAKRKGKYAKVML